MLRLQQLSGEVPSAAKAAAAALAQDLSPFVHAEMARDTQQSTLHPFSTYADRLREAGAVPSLTALLAALPMRDALALEGGRGAVCTNHPQCGRQQIGSCRHPHSAAGLISLCTEGGFCEMADRLCGMACLVMAEFLKHAQPGVQAVRPTFQPGQAALSTSPLWPQLRGVQLADPAL